MTYGEIKTCFIRSIVAVFFILLSIMLWTFCSNITNPEWVAVKAWFFILGGLAGIIAIAIAGITIGQFYSGELE